MEMEERSSQFTSFLFEHKLSVVLGIVALICFAYGLITFLASGTAASSDIVFESSAKQNSEIVPTMVSKSIMVDVAGAVQKPGVYALPSDSRVQDALIAAGGISANADSTIIAKTLNLAAKLSDGAKLYIPSLGELGTSTDTSVLGEGTAAININTATAQVLESLPGVGSVTANKIIANRPYVTIEELVSKKAVSQSVFTKIKEMVTVY